jgi:hypothetical protein
MLGFFRDPRANDWEEVDKSDHLSQFLKSQQDAEVVPSYAFTDAGEASAAVLLARLLAARNRTCC